MARRVWPWLRTLAGVGIIAALTWRLGADAFVTGFRRVDGAAVAAALAIGLLTTVPSAARWCLVARRLGMGLTLPTAVADYYRAMFLNTVLPGGVLGDAHRALRHGQRAGAVGRGVHAVVLERMAGQAVLVVAGVVALVVHPALATAVARGPVPTTGGTVPVLGALAAVAGLVAVAWWGSARWARTARWRRACVTVLADTRAGLLGRDTWPGVVLLSAGAVLGHVALFLVAARTAGASAPLAQLVPLALLALLAMALPLNVGGWGPREAFLALAFGAAGLGATEGLTVSVAYGVLAFVACLPGAAVLLLRRAARPARVPRADRPAGDLPSGGGAPAASAPATTGAGSRQASRSAR